MGRIGTVLSFIRAVKKNGVNFSEVKSDPGGGDNSTSEHFSAPGDDSQPLKGDFIALMNIVREGGKAVIGYLDPKNPGIAEEGEKRIYSRDSEGNVVAEVWLKNDGTTEVKNGEITFILNPDGSHKLNNSSGSFELLANGDVNINGVIIKANGDVTTPGTIVATKDITSQKNIVAVVALSGASLAVIGGGAAVIAGDITSNGGKISTTGEISGGTVKSGSIVLGTHTHGGVQTGGDSTGGPQ